MCKQVGGKDDKNIVKNVLATTISEQIVQNFTWHGLRGKDTFKTTQTACCILNALKELGLTEYFIAQNAGDWMRHYSDRMHKKEKLDKEMENQN